MTTPPEKSVVILGATSGVARPLAARFAQRGYSVGLTGRRQDELEALAADLHIRYNANCPVLPFDALAFDEHAAFPGRCEKEFGCMPDGVVLCFGTMAEQAEAQASFPLARRMIDTNLTGAVSILETFAEIFEQRKSGFIAALSSVAGERGRKGNYLYGASKAGLSVYLQGLRNRLQSAGVQVTTLKPGFMDTPMTHGMDLPGVLTTQPEAAAAAMANAILKKKDIAFIPFYWRTIMLMIRAIPERIFKKMSI